MMINESTNMSGSIVVKSTVGNGDVDTIVAYVTASLDGNAQSLNINLNVSNKVLLNSTGAMDIAGETPAVQYTEFETAVKARAKELGYVIFV
ncbi:hypothetical protein [Clostridium akagii]|uniref:hypothetical protein n=1 Tax=Clostridium akagii TaxID=91623 RepID=UPI00047C0F8C|nr:hypothetical protein [Clostridium akagii]